MITILTDAKNTPSMTCGNELILRCPCKIFHRWRDIKCWESGVCSGDTFVMLAMSNKCPILKLLCENLVNNSTLTALQADLCFVFVMFMYWMGVPHILVLKRDCCSLIFEKTFWRKRDFKYILLLVLVDGKVAQCSKIELWDCNILRYIEKIVRLNH